MKRIYLDWAATTPIDERVKKEIKKALEVFGNPSSIHWFGQEAQKLLDQSREKIAKILKAQFEEIIFTGSATEANNLAILGLVKKLKGQRGDYNLPKIIVSSIEHASVYETSKNLAEAKEAEIIYLKTDKQGIVSLKELEQQLDKKTILVSIGYVNNEIGTKQPIEKISKLIEKFRQKNNSEYPLFHTDAVQAFGFFDCSVDKLGVDLMTLSAHKIFGPKGVGLLYIKENVKKLIAPIIFGGGQEFSKRAGTENIALIAGFAKALELAQQEREKNLKIVKELAVFFAKELKKIAPVEINGPEIDDDNRSFHILNFYFKKSSAEELLIRLDLEGVAVSSGSACSVKSLKPSSVIQALGYDLKRAKNSLRFSFSKLNTKEEVKRTIKIIKKIIN